MKKILALVLVLMMALVSVSALAEDSKQNENISGATADGADVTLDIIDDNEDTAEIKQKITDAEENGNAIDGLPEDVQDQLPEGYVIINEMDTYQMDGDFENAEDLITLTFKFETPYEEGEKVIVLFGIVPPEEDKETEWLVKDGVGNADGDVEVVVTKEELQKISDNPFVVIPVSK